MPLFGREHPENILSEIPGTFFPAIDSDLNWHYHTEQKQDNFTSSTQDKSRVYWPRGKSLGGSSAINGVIYIQRKQERL